MHPVSLGCACSIGRRWPSYDTLPGMRLTVVVENRASPGCSGAHGFAAWLEAGSAVVLVLSLIHLQMCIRDRLR